MDRASFDTLTPLRFLERSALVFGDRVAVIDGPRRYTFAELQDRSAHLGGALRQMGVGAGDRVAVLCPNTRVLLEAHYGVPMAGAVLVAMNIRLTSSELSYIMDHSGASVLIFDHRFRDRALASVASLDRSVRLIEADGPSQEYEALLTGAPVESIDVVDELSLLSINYTSGTTGKPKGVMYSHRGAYLQALAMALHTGLGPGSVFLWTLPMFHCNGWCFTWAVTVGGGVHLCLPEIDPAEIWRLIHEEGVTHFNAAPTVLIMLANHPDADAGPAHARVRVCTGGAPPSPTLLARLQDLNMEVTHLYGLTETYGPVAICEWRPEWSALPLEEQARLKARQGVGNVISTRLRVVDETAEDVPADGRSMGEVAVRGNNLMLGYYADPDATARAVPDGWFRTGDLGVMHPDGYIELRDRSKDIIISGGENIASIEVEQAIMSHPSVLEAAVVAAPDDKWGEVPVAFVTLKPGSEVSGEEITRHVRDQIAGFKAPKTIRFGDLPKTSTGKIQKYVLRGWAAELGPGDGERPGGASSTGP